ncbi:MAG: flagellar biosynthesis protein FlhF [Lachnospiraceae bacterium]|nr:flagellar biosynthesis protein FlhF [Lachnospiraceae bacterium]
MIIKKFQGKTEEEATGLAKKELGPAVVIMNVRTVKSKGIFAIFKKPVVEVTAALEDEPERTSYKPILPAATVRQAAARAYDEAAAGKEDIKKESGNDKSSQETPGRSDAVESLEEKLESLHLLIEKQMQKESGEVDFDTDSDEQVSFFKLIYNTLIDNEVDEKYANEIIDELDKIRKKGSGIDLFLANIYQKMILQFGQPASITPSDEGAKLVFFIGPTGVGKTTTIAKIASRLNVDEKKKVALLTTDTYRIAAAEQLRTYANILDAPFRVIYTEDEIKTALEDFKAFDYILVDTAGHSHHNEAQKNSMKEFLHCVDGIIEKEVYLVVSATTKYRDLLSIADAYTEMTDYKLIFTKLDETTTLGNLFNLRKHTGAQMSYITCGQNVPDDIEQFSPQNTVKQLLGGR